MNHLVERFLRGMLDDILNSILVSSRRIGREARLLRSPLMNFEEWAFVNNSQRCWVGSTPLYGLLWSPYGKPNFSNSLGHQSTADQVNGINNLQTYRVNFAPASDTISVSNDEFGMHPPYTQDRECRCVTRPDPELPSGNWTTPQRCSARSTRTRDELFGTVWNYLEPFGTIWNYLKHWEQHLHRLKWSVERSSFIKSGESHRVNNMRPMFTCVDAKEEVHRLRRVD